MTFPPSRPDAGLIAAVRALLGEARYEEGAVCGALGLPTLGALSAGSFGAIASRLEQASSPLAILIRLLLLERDVPRDEAERALGREAIHALDALGLLAVLPSRRLAAEVALVPCGDALIATDRRSGPSSGTPGGRRDRVMYLGSDSYLLACLAPGVEAGAQVLDLCTGSGVHAILAALRGARAVGLDINPRATVFARFNAALNGVGGSCVFRTGDLYRPLGRLARPAADLVLCNPPFVASPFLGADRLLFRDAGPLGDEVLRRALRGLGRRLAPGGMAVFVTAFADLASAAFEERLARWLGPPAGLGGLLLVTDRATPDEVAAVHATRMTPRGPRLAADLRTRWLAALLAAGITSVGGGLLVLTRQAAGRGGPVRTLDFTPSWRPDRRVLARLLAAGSPGPAAPASR